MFGIGGRWRRAAAAGAALGFLAGAGPAPAVERLVSVGTSLLIPFEVDPETKKNDLTYGIDTAVYVDDWWAGVLAWEFGLQGAERVNFGIGPRLFLSRGRTIRPYLSAQFVSVLLPERALGWRVNLGLEVNLRPLTRVDNLRLALESGIQHLFLTATPDLLLAELLRVGMSWSF